MSLLRCSMCADILKVSYGCLLVLQGDWRARRALAGSGGSDVGVRSADLRGGASRCNSEHNNKSFADQMQDVHCSSIECASQLRSKSRQNNTANAARAHMAGCCSLREREV
jgi:hypothetical protein